jgi:lipopolysaccharide transport system ATP-binding protein
MREDIILRVENLSKVYDTAPAKYNQRFADVLNIKSGKEQGNTFTALDNVSFELKRGESLGIIGPNGAGKSTLLRILSGITKPTTGKVEIFGRCLSVLDIGTGFHPDLTGRENIYLSGEILGMTQKEIERKYKEIVAFSGIEESIHQPVKTYSSGMYLRLAFSVVINMDADLLIFDEVLAVGDKEFRNKCIDKVYELLYANKSLIIASHNDSQIVNLTNTCLLLDKGVALYFGKPQEAIFQATANTYNAEKIEGKDKHINVGFNVDSEEEDVSDVERDVILDSSPIGNTVHNPNVEVEGIERDLLEASNRDPLNGINIISVEILDESNNPNTGFKWEDSITIRLKYQLKESGSDLGIAIIIQDSAEYRLMVFNTLELEEKYRMHKGTYEISWKIPPYIFGPGTFYLELITTLNGKIFNRKGNILFFQIASKGKIGNYETYTPIKVNAEIKKKKNV